MFMSCLRDKFTLSQQNLATDVSVGFQPPYWCPSIKKTCISRMKNCTVWREGKNDDDDDESMFVLCPLMSTVTEFTCTK